MSLSEVRVKLDLIHERILDEAIERKFFKTKNDAINAGILLLWKKHRPKATKMFNKL
jgi:Arc/MetJ-type ribon-helix-helix transcriptional regulator